MAHIILLGTCDTKLVELRYLRERILAHAPKARVTLIDVGRTAVSDPAITISQVQLIQKYGMSLSNPTSADRLQEMPRSEVLATTSALAVACVRDLLDSISGVIAAGGSGNTSVAAAVMQACSTGLPKLLVSTVASGDVAPIVGEVDVTLMYSVVDIAGLNRVLRSVLDNAAAAITGMAGAYALRKETPSLVGSAAQSRRQIGVTMFGVTTPCVDAVRRRLEEKGADVYVFHATGSGGKAMERLIKEGSLDAVLDVTTTEVCDLLVGGVMSAGPDRLRAAVERGIPYVVSLGACDMVNFGGRTTVPERFKDRQLLEHNSMVTLMRTNIEECKMVGTWIARRLEAAEDQTRIELWIPEGGISMLSMPGQPFHDPVADRALFDAVESGLQDTAISVIRDKRAINDAELATAMADRLIEIIGIE